MREEAVSKDPAVHSGKGMHCSRQSSVCKVGRGRLPQRQWGSSEDGGKLRMVDRQLEKVKNIVVPQKGPCWGHQHKFWSGTASPDELLSPNKQPRIEKAGAMIGPDKESADISPKFSHLIGSMINALSSCSNSLPDPLSYEASSPTAPSLLFPTFCDFHTEKDESSECKTFWGWLRENS